VNNQAKILIEFYKNNAQISQIFRAVGKNDLAISIVNEAELYFGALNKVELKMIKQHVASLHRFALDTAVFNHFLQLMETYSLSHKLSIPDALIAATALVHNHNRLANMKKKNQLAEEEIDELVIAQADDNDAWEESVTVERDSAATLSLPPELASRAAFLPGCTRCLLLNGWKVSFRSVWPLKNPPLPV
jgi:predicted nucleic acid-binding protein